MSRETLEQDIEGAGVEVVTSQDGKVIAPFIVGRRGSPAKFGVVEDIIVKKGGSMKVLDYVSERDVLGALITLDLGAETDEERTEPFAAAPCDIRRDPGEKFVPGCEIVENGTFYGLEIVGETLEDPLEGPLITAEGL
jgi:hypothetical protein